MAGYRRVICRSLKGGDRVVVGYRRRRRRRHGGGFVWWEVRDEKRGQIRKTGLSRIKPRVLRSNPGLLPTSLLYLLLKTRIDSVGVKASPFAQISLVRFT